MTVDATYGLTQAVIDVLRNGGLSVGDAVKPKNVPAGDGYVVVYGVGGEIDGDMDEPESEPKAIYQLTGVGALRVQADDVQMVAYPLMLSLRDTVIDGWKVLYVRREWFNSSSRDDDVQPPLFTSRAHYRIAVTPYPSGGDES